MSCYIDKHSSILLIFSMSQNPKYRVTHTADSNLAGEKKVPRQHGATLRLSTD
jgi:hypothetical protein